MQLLPVERMASPWWSKTEPRAAIVSPLSSEARGERDEGRLGSTLCMFFLNHWPLCSMRESYTVSLQYESVCSLCVRVWLLLFNHQIVSNSSWPHGPQHARLPCPSPSPEMCPLNWWCHPTISSSVTLFSSFLPSFPESGSFSVNWLFASDGQSIWASALASVLPVNIQGRFPLWLTGLISLMSKGFSRVFSNTTIQNHQFLGFSAFFMVQLSHPWEHDTYEILRHPSLPTLDKAWVPEALLSGIAFLLLCSLHLLVLLLHLFPALVLTLLLAQQAQLRAEGFAAAEVALGAAWSHRKMAGFTNESSFSKQNFRINSQSMRKIQERKDAVCSAK